MVGQAADLLHQDGALSDRGCELEHGAMTRWCKYKNEGGISLFIARTSPCSPRHLHKMATDFACDGGGKSEL